MKRIPKVGDTVIVVPLSPHTRNKAIIECVVKNVGRKYFYTDRDAFEIESFSNGAWLDKSSGYGSGHYRKAYVSQEVYDRLLLKQKQIATIDEIKKSGWCCTKVNAVLDFINSLDDMEGAEEWET